MKTKLVNSFDGTILLSPENLNKIKFWSTFQNDQLFTIKMTCDMTPLFNSFMVYDH